MMTRSCLRERFEMDGDDGNCWCLLSTYCAPGTVPGSLHVLYYLILTIAYEVGVCYYPPCTDGGQCPVAPMNLRSEMQLRPEKADGQSHNIQDHNSLLGVCNHPSGRVSCSETWGWHWLR